jgi:hypothetical protein
MLQAGPCDQGAGPLQTLVAIVIGTGRCGVLAGMLLPSRTRQRRVLCRIEKMLLRDDPGLGSLFAVFTRLTLHEAMPWTEQARPVRWQPRTLVIAAGLAAILAALAVGLLTSSSHTCGTAPVAGQHPSVSRAASCSPAPARMPGRPSIR